jgi:two-component system sensor histidine kinase VicK
VKKSDKNHLINIKQNEQERTYQAMLNILEDLKQSEYKLEAKVYQLNTILSLMREALVAVDDKNNIVFINQAAAALFRIAPADAIGRPASKVCVFYHNGHKVAEKDTPVKKAINESAMVSYGINDELFVKDPSNVMAPVACTASFLAGDYPVKVIMILRDITKEKEIDTAKSELISLVSHQLRTPLSSINWYSEMLLSDDAGVLNNDQRGYIQEIFNGNHRMIELVNSLLNVSRVDLGTLSVYPEELSLRDIANGVIADLKMLIKDKELRIEVAIPIKVSKYLGDKKIVTIIFQNLISNAVKYTPKKGLINVKAEIRPKGESVALHELKHESLILSVSDNGIGIPEKAKSKIFSKLYRADNVRGLETNGNGLGLYLVKTLITSIGGSVWFSSEENKGTTFYVSLPSAGMRKRNGTTIFT